MEKDINIFLTTLGTSEQELKEGWSKEDRKLFEFLSQCDKNEFATILGLLANRWNNDPCTDEFFKAVTERFPDHLTNLDQIVGAMLVVYEIRQYSGHTFLPIKPPYEKTLTKVHKRIGKHFKSTVPEVATVVDRERSITILMVGEAINNLTPEELETALKGADLPPSLVREKQKQILLQTIAAGGFEGLVALLGKNVIKKAVIGIVEKYLAKKISQEALAETLKRVGTKLPAHFFKRAFLWIGIALLIKDVWDLSGEATRITTPLVTSIAISRTLARAQTD